MLLLSHSGQPARRLGLIRILGLALAAAVLGTSSPARAGAFSWLDEVVQQIIVEARGGKAVLHTGDAARIEARGGGKLFAKGTEEGLEGLVKQSDEFAAAARRVENPSELLLESRFGQLVGRDADALRTFSALKPAEKRVVVEMGESARRIAQRYPQEAEAMIGRLGPEGLTAVRTFGDDVAEVLAKEGPESLGVLRKTGRGGWEFLTTQVLPHKKKLAAAGVLAAFYANPDAFIDYTGRATEYAAREFARAGVTLATTVGGGLAQGLETSIGEALASRGLDFLVFRKLGVILAGLVACGALLVVLGMPMRTMLRPFTGALWLFRKAVSRRSA
ncbi:hypothetical protein [Planctomyces sp. SH-PL62]|uniref:hypothetical protein n=1 Tax=Planctomyces sp. SH-PL62 TaxID=1636152 RepID=UPI00078B7FA4|nr:hypothetical protein [Planctomyces sp. SH-PL62]AMV35930.1 hypothetical protein VT85_00700 [Planctomyces sp. SH-PL62]